MERKLTCIGCPLGCEVTVELDGSEVVSVAGNTCPRGEAYARKEVTNPTRIVTTTVRVEGGVLPAVSVKTKLDVPKNKIIECVKELQRVTVKAPVFIGDIVCRDVAGTGVDVAATKNVKMDNQKIVMLDKSVIMH